MKPQKGNRTWVPKLKRRLSAVCPKKEWNVKPFKYSGSETSWREMPRFRPQRTVWSKLRRKKRRRSPSPKRGIKLPSANAAHRRLIFTQRTVPVNQFMILFSPGITTAVEGITIAFHSSLVSVINAGTPGRVYWRKEASFKRLQPRIRCSGDRKAEDCHSRPRP